MSTLSQNTLSEKDYLAIERGSAQRHEYDQGEIFAMGGASANHNQIVAICGQPHDDDRKDTPLNPTVIIEVLSPSTEAYDRGEKFSHYRQVDARTLPL